MIDEVQRCISSQAEGAWLLVMRSASVIPKQIIENQVPVGDAAVASARQEGNARDAGGLLVVAAVKVADGLCLGRRFQWTWFRNRLFQLD